MYEKTKIAKLAKRKFKYKYTNAKIYWKVKYHCHYTGKYRSAANSTCNLKYSIPKETPAVFHNKSNYDYHFIIKQLVKGFAGEFDCLGGKTKKYKTFAVAITKEDKRVHKNGEEIRKMISYKWRFIDRAGFLAGPLSNLVDNLAEGIHKIKWKNGHDSKKCETYGIMEFTYGIVNAILNTQTLKTIKYYTNAYIAVRITNKSLTKN